MTSASKPTNTLVPLEFDLALSDDFSLSALIAKIEPVAEVLEYCKMNRYNGHATILVMPKSEAVYDAWNDDGLEAFYAFIDS